MWDILLLDIEKDLCKKPTFFAFVKYLFLKRSFQAVFLYRFRHKIANSKYISKLNLFFDWFSFFLTSSDISAHAVIGYGLYLPHPTGIVIGSGCVIGNNVTIYQNVTLGRKNTTISEYPTICDGVTVCCGAAVLGRVTIGNDSIIGANSVVTKSFEMKSVIVGIPGHGINND